MVATKAAAIAIGKPFPRVQGDHHGAETLEKFVGVYKIDDKTTRTIRLDDGKLSMQRTGQGRFPMLAYKENAFFIPDSLLFLEFGRNAKGEVTSLTTTIDGGDPVAHARTGDKPVERTAVAMSPAAFDAYVGRYQLEGFHIDVKREGAKFIAQLTGQPAFEVFPSSDTTFFLKVVDAELQFEKTADGGMQLMLNQGGRKTPGKRI